MLLFIPLVWILCFIFSAFFLGGLPLPPTPNRPFFAEAIGSSRVAEFNDVCRFLAEGGRNAPGLLVLGLFIALFFAWLFLRRVRQPEFVRKGVPVYRFLFLFLTAFLVADYDRDFEIKTLQDYFNFRSDWILGGMQPGYPKWPTVTLKNALISGDPTEIDFALEAVLAPPFGKVPAFTKLTDSCKTIFRGYVLQSGKPTPGDVTNPSTYQFACLLLKDIGSHLGRLDAADSRMCVYGPAVKVLHALDVQHISCPLTILEGEKSKAVICPRFQEAFGTQNFAFCRP